MAAELEQARDAVAVGTVSAAETTIGPVGFAETISTCTRSAGSAQPPPYPSPISASASRKNPSPTRTLMKPGPATSADATSSRAAIVSAYSCASSRGGRPTAFADRRAMFVAKSP